MGGSLRAVGDLGVLFVQVKWCLNNILSRHFSHCSFSADKNMPKVH